MLRKRQAKWRSNNATDVEFFILAGIAFLVVIMTVVLVASVVRLAVNGASGG